MNIITFVPSLKLVNELYTSKLEREDLDKGIVVNQLKEDIIFKNVNFTHLGSKPLFADITLNIQKGKTTAIVGASGAGKSTLVDLIVGFFKYNKGEILVNGIDLKKINLLSWRNLIGYVSQDIFLFNTTVRENILIGKPSASEEEILVVAKKANADLFIQALPQGYNTLLGERGLKLSGGQRQRIAIARAIIRDPELFIFDEATSSLDVESEKSIQESIYELAKEKTIIIIAHRLSTIENADVIYILDKGCIVELNSREESIENVLSRLSSNK
jgi:subfamily B ATP-binding cassette protein MsbA